MNKTIKEIAILIYVTIIWVVILITIAITPRDDEKMKYIELLNIAKSKELNVTKLFIANEVDILIRKYVKERYDKILSTFVL